MVSSSGKKELLVMSIIGFVCMFLSVYLIYDHIKDEDASFCDVGSHISCSKVRRSSFSELFGVPIAVFGLLYHIASILVSLSAIQLKGKQENMYIAFLFYWNVFGVAFIVYLVCAEIYLGAMCPFCTVLHIFQMISMWIIWKVYDSKSSMPTLMEVCWEMRWWIVCIGIFNCIPMLYFNVSPVFSEIQKDAVVMNEAFSTCITHSGWRFYGLKACGWCAKQKALFGDTLSRIMFIDCGEQRDTCEVLDITGYPTWIQFDDDGVEINTFNLF